MQINSFSHIIKTMTSSSKLYEDALHTLNSLASNASTLQKIRIEKDKYRHLSLPQTVEMAERAGVKLSDIDKLSVIHVSGTKGKGSTCAFCESILRAHGYKTGFFSSPHLVEVRERIRINGRVLSKQSFSKYFWDCYSKLDATKDQYGGDMPAFFRFLTIMAFHVFLQEKVDVAILEVGIGGAFDCTNIVRQPVTCGVTSLGLDHVSILGDTIDQIAWHKAGIFKPGVPSFTVPQPELAMEVLVQRAKEVGCSLHRVPSLDNYEWDSMSQSLGIAGEVQRWNASLALQLSKTWIENSIKKKCLIKNSTCNGLQKMNEVFKPKRESNMNGDADLLSGNENVTFTPEVFAANQPATAMSFDITERMHSGLRDCWWPGRSQVINRDRVTLYLDGAHTSESLQACVQWFNKTAAEEAAHFKNVVRVLLFNMTGDRKPCVLLAPLLSCCFDIAVFCPNIITAKISAGDHVHSPTSSESPIKRCALNRNAWLYLLESVLAESTAADPNKADQQEASGFSLGKTSASPPASSEMKCASMLCGTNNITEDVCRASCADQSMPIQNKWSATSVIADTIHSALSFVSSGNGLFAPGLEKDTYSVPLFCTQEICDRLKSASCVQVLCTGSLHLVGGVLALVEPEINNEHL